MPSLFGLPLDTVSNLTDVSELVPGDKPPEEKLQVVGGEFLDQNNKILELFYHNDTASTQHAELFAMVSQLYTLVPIIVIILCQIGFALVQSGASRVESAAIPFVANALVFATSCLSFWAVGYTLARSEGLTVLGYHQWFSHEFDTEFSVDWLLHFSLVLTTANIATSGGLERCPRYVYCLLSPLVAGVVGAISSRWCWHHDSWTVVHSPFQGVVYKDQGGSGVIHVVGGSSALILSVILGPRYSRIRDATSILYNDIDGHSLPMEMLGWYTCIVCFVCCNCVRLTSTCIMCQSISKHVARALVNTVISAATASLTTVAIVHLMKVLLGRKRFHYLTSRQLTNGALVGVVSVAAGCDAYPHWASFVVGWTSSICYVVWSQALYTGKVDDPIGVVAVHLGGGLWGVICVHLFSEKTGLLFADDPSTAGLAIVWNTVIALILAAGSAALTGAVLMIPRGFSLIPITHMQEMQGVDVAFLGQQAYPSGDKVTHFTTDVIEDREDFVDSNPTSPPTTVTSPMSYSFTGLRSDNQGLPGQYDREDFVDSNPTSPPTTVTSPVSYSFTGLRSDNQGLPGQYDISNPYHKLDIGLKHLPSFSRSPMDADRRVWFSGECLPDQVAPMTPIIDYHRRGSDRWEDIEF